MLLKLIKAYEYRGNKFYGFIIDKTCTPLKTQPLDQHQFAESSEKAALEFPHPGHTTTQTTIGYNGLTPVTGQIF